MCVWVGDEPLPFHFCSANSIPLAPKHSRRAISPHAARAGPWPRQTQAHTHTHTWAQLKRRAGGHSVDRLLGVYAHQMDSCQAAGVCLCVYVCVCRILTFQSIVEKNEWRLISSTPSAPAPAEDRTVSQSTHTHTHVHTHTHTHTGTV